jgi:tetratricopeptide (TPR) repeat protein
MSLLLIETAYMFSITLPQKLRREWLMRALEITRNSQDADSKKWFPLLLMSEAWHHFDAHRFEEALEIFRAAQNQCQEVENSNLRRILKWCEARALRALKQPDQALKIQEDILNTMDRPEVMDGFVYLEIAECWQDLHLKSKSQPYYEMALAALEKNTWYSDNYGHELSRIQKNAKKN